MADIAVAIVFVIALEDDHQHPGCITQLRGDSGGRTRLGIAQRWHPDLTKSGFYDGDPIAGSVNPLRWTPTTVSEEAGAGIAASVYQRQYAEPLMLSEIGSQDLANRLLAFAVNEGLRQAVVLLQRCLDTAADGEMGPNTLSQANGRDAGALIASMKAEQVAFYRNLAANNPNLAEYAGGLQNRAEA